MRTLLIAVLLLGSVGAGSLSAADAPRDRDACSDRGAREAAKAYGARARDYCEVRWTGRLAERETGGQTHDEFVDGCLRRCVTSRNATAGAPLGWVLGGAIDATALAAAIAAGTGGHAPPPPASP
jgi:hypothetical protein